MNINALTAANIRQTRESLNLPMKYVAKKLSMSISAYNKLENGLTQITVEKLKNIALLFGVSILDLLPLIG